MSCAILLLAGEPCPRWGRPPALLPVGGDCLVNHLARAALNAGGDPIFRVLGAHALAVANRPAPPGVEDVFNPDWSRGPGSAVVRGLRAALSRADDLDGVVWVPCEPSGFTAAHLRATLDAIERAPDALAQIDPPAGAASASLLGFGRAYFSELLALPAAADPRQIVNRHLNRRVLLPFHAPAAGPAGTTAPASTSATPPAAVAALFSTIRVVG